MVHLHKGNFEITDAIQGSLPSWGYIMIKANSWRVFWYSAGEHTNCFLNTRGKKTCEGSQPSQG